MVLLTPMTAEEFRDFIDRRPLEIAASQVRLGIWEKDEAAGLARTEVAEWLPQGLDTPGHHFCVVQSEATEERVGDLWYCLRPRGRRKQLFVCWIGIDEKYRRQGHATAALHQMQAEAHSFGAYLVGLGVDADNVAALTLYTKMGFVPKNIFMTKPVVP
ncbi:MAG: GNAT family N-acetyltransferase [Candidatus Lutacidiplasmatales archaeon]